MAITCEATRLRSPLWTPACCCRTCCTRVVVAHACQLRCACQRSGPRCRGFIGGSGDKYRGMAVDDATLVGEDLQPIMITSAPHCLETDEN